MFDQQNFREFKKRYALFMPLPVCTTHPHIHTHNTPRAHAPAEEPALYPAGSCEKVAEEGCNIMEVEFKRIILLQ